MIELLTERLLIRDHVDSDLLSHHDLLSNKESMYYLQDICTRSLEESKKNLEVCIGEINKKDRKFYFFRIVLKGSNEHIGEIGYTVDTYTPLGKRVSLGYFLRKEHFGNGYTVEALNEVMRYAFTKGGVYRISCGCLKENVNSEKVMNKCGMIKEGEMKSFEFFHGNLKDRVIYRLLKEEWFLLENNKDKNKVEVQIGDFLVKLNNQRNKFIKIKENININDRKASTNNELKFILQSIMFRFSGDKIIMDGDKLAHYEIDMNAITQIFNDENGYIIHENIDDNKVRTSQVILMDLEN